ncbi:hypothetical protein JCM3765_000457 [Sporobolomyces pararoseus]
MIGRTHSLESSTSNESPIESKKPKTHHLSEQQQYAGSEAGSERGSAEAEEEDQQQQPLEQSVHEHQSSNSLASSNDQTSRSVAQTPSAAASLPLDPSSLTQSTTGLPSDLENDVARRWYRGESVPTLDSLTQGIINAMTAVALLENSKFQELEKRIASIEAASKEEKVIQGEQQKILDKEREEKAKLERKVSQLEAELKTERSKSGYNTNEQGTQRKFLSPLSFFLFPSCSRAPSKITSHRFVVEQHIKVPRNQSKEVEVEQSKTQIVHLEEKISSLEKEASSFVESITEILKLDVAPASLLEAAQIVKTHLSKLQEQSTQREAKSKQEVEILIQDIKCLNIENQRDFVARKKENEELLETCKKLKSPFGMIGITAKEREAHKAAEKEVALLKIRVEVFKETLAGMEKVFELLRQTARAGIRVKH